MDSAADRQEEQHGDESTLLRAQENRAKALRRLQELRERREKEAAETAVGEILALSALSSKDSDPAKGRWREQEDAEQIAQGRASGGGYSSSEAVVGGRGGGGGGGFLLEDDDDNEPDAKRRRTLPPPRQLVADPPRSFFDNENPHCIDCGTVEVCPDYLRWFKIAVCRPCRQQGSEDKYELITKTEVRDVFLLTDSELNSEDLPHLLRANPLNPNWSNMKLYLRCQVEEFALKKWGSEEGLNQEFERREEENRKKRSKKFNQTLTDLRKRTRTSLWSEADRGRAKHVHEWEAKQQVSDDLWSRRCKTCGITVEFEEL